MMILALVVIWDEDLIDQENKITVFDYTEEKESPLIEVYCAEGVTDCKDDPPKEVHPMNYDDLIDVINSSFDF